MLLKLTTAAAAFLIWTPVASAWSWPVQGPVLQPFSYDEAHPYDAGQHRGIDIGAAETGDPVVAPASGSVSFAGFAPTSGESVTIETADGYSVTLTHLGSIGVAEGATVAEGDAVATVGPSGTPEQSVPYVHLGVRLTADSLGYLDPLGLLPPVATPTPTPTPTPQPKPQPKPVHVPEHERGGGLVVVEKPAVASPVSHPAAPAEPTHVPAPKPKPQPTPAPSVHVAHVEAPHVRQSVAPPLTWPSQVVTSPVVHAVGGESLVLAIAPGLVASLLALITAFTRDRRAAPLPARIIPFRREVAFRRAA